MADLPPTKIIDVIGPVDTVSAADVCCRDECREHPRGCGCSREATHTYSLRACVRINTRHVYYHAWLMSGTGTIAGILEGL